MKKIITILIIGVFFLGGCKNNSDKDIKKHFQLKKYDRKKNITKEMYGQISNFNYVVYRDKIYTYYGDMEVAAYIYKFNKNLKPKLVKEIRRGKGPNEAMHSSGIFYFKENFYLYDDKLKRFLKFDNYFKFSETVNINKAVPINCFSKVRNKLYGIGYNIEDYLIVYEVKVDCDKVKVKSKFKIKHEEETKNPFLKAARRGLQKIVDNDQKLVIQSFDSIFFFKKKKEKYKLKFIKQIILPSNFERTAGNKKIANTSILAVDRHNNFLFEYCDNYYIYNFNKDDKKEIKKPKFDKIVNILGNKYWIYNNEDKDQYYVKYKINK